MSEWPLAPLRRLRAREEEVAARGLGTALHEERQAAARAAGAGRALAAVCQGGGRGGAGELARTAAWAGRRQAVARAAGAASLASRAALLEARRAGHVLALLEGRWQEVRRRVRERREEAADEDGTAGRWGRARPPGGGRPGARGGG